MTFYEFIIFKFRNIGPALSSITDVYFDDGPLLGIDSITNGPGTSFSNPATPANLPAGNNAIPPFVTTNNFSADSNSGPPGVMVNGVNPNEYVMIVFNLINGKMLNDVLADLTDGDLRTGIHVQGYASGGSESFVNGTPIPEPATMLLRY
jgi:hypothetical protein